MKTCPVCGHENPDAADQCERCNLFVFRHEQQGKTQMPPVGQAQLLLPPPPAFRTKQRRYLLGLALGLVPVILWWLGAATATGYEVFPGSSSWQAGLGFLLYLVELVAMLVCLFIRRMRFVGYGLLTMILAGPVVGALGCSVIASRPH